MSQFEASTARRPSSNVYTVLILVAFVALAGAVAVTWQANTQLTGEKSPFQMVDLSRR